jgi:sarcosine oxidase subunit beta
MSEPRARDREADLAVVGAGIAGASAAYYAAKAGMSVVLVDRNAEPGGGTASAATAAGVRAQGRAPFELPLDTWPGLAGELGADIGYERNGMAICIDDDGQWDALRRRVAQERGAGFDVRLLDAAEIRALVPEIGPAIRGGSYLADDGQAHPIRTLRALVDGARRAGAVLALGESVVDLARAPGGAERARFALRTERRTIRARATLLAAGAWTAELVRLAGIELPIRAAALQMLATEPSSVRVKPVLAWVGKAISLKQLPSGRFWIGGGWAADSDGAGRTATRLESIAGSARTARDLVPALASVRITRAWAGREAYTPDEQPLIGAVAACPGLWVAAGFSGHGFAIGPGVGRLLAEWFTTGNAPAALRPFDPARFGEKHAAEATEAKESGNL